MIPDTGSCPKKNIEKLFSKTSTNMSSKTMSRPEGFPTILAWKTEPIKMYFNMLLYVASILGYFSTGDTLI